jgi:uncharacterized lipoprotein YajG
MQDMTKTKHILCLIASAALLSACAKTGSVSGPSSPITSAYHVSQITPGALGPQSIDTKRYSDMHITQSSYLFK